MRSSRVALFAGLAIAPCFLGLLAVSACAFSNEASDSPGDPPVDAGTPSALGGGARIHAVAPTTDPDGGPNPEHPAPDASVYITGASVVIIDGFDETADGKSIGSVYVEDVSSGPALPYSGIQMYRPTYSPASLLLAPGDIVDFTGTYQDYAYSGFSPFQTTPEAYEPIVSFRFEYKVPSPKIIQLGDISNVTPQAAYDLGQRWLSMLVEIDDVTIVGAGSLYKGRVSYYMTSNSSTGPAIANQLYDLQATDYPAGTHFSKVIGVCNFFFNFTISPRSPADLVP